MEGSISQAVRRTSTRRTRYRSLAKTLLAQVLTAAALNLYRLDAWWTGTPPGHDTSLPLRTARPQSRGLTDKNPDHIDQQSPSGAACREV